MEAEDPGPIAILVVEDETAIRRLISLMLENRGFDVFAAATVQQALIFLDTYPQIDMAVIDMVMPGMSGLDLAAEMDRRHPHIKILYITGYVASIAIQAISDRKPDSVLLKPFTESQLIGRIRRILGLAAEQSGEHGDPIVPSVDAAWKHLIEGSDDLSYPYRIASYRNTPAAYSIAAAHAAVLRQAGIPYHFAADKN